MAKQFDGKVAIITGAARGQGQSHAVCFAEEGADVIAVDLRAQIDSVAYPMATSADLEETVNFAEILDVASLPSRPTSAPSKRSKPL